MTVARTQLLVIDAQNDFCDLPADWCPPAPLVHAAGNQPARLRPALPVPGAHADLLRLAVFMHQMQARLDDITLTLDTHHRVHIAHPVVWQQGDGSEVSPFTAITAEQVRAGRYQPRAARHLPRVLDYLDRLEAAGRYTLMVWPVHGEIGTWGHGLHPGVLMATRAWEERHLRPAHKLHKGSEVWTEHYSALQAEVPDPARPATQLNRALLDRLCAAETLYIAGQASSHCVRATVEDLLRHGPAGTSSRLVLLADCMSPVSGFEAAHKDFLAAMRSQGVRVAHSVDIAGAA